MRRNLLRGPYKRNEYRKVILSLAVLRRFDCLLAATKAQVLTEHAAIPTTESSKASTRSGFVFNIAASGTVLPVKVRRSLHAF